MPKIDLTLPDDALTPGARSKLPGELAAALLRWEGAPDSSFFRSISWTHLHELPADAMHTADGQATESQGDRRGHHTAGRPERAQAGRPCRGGDELVLDATGWGEDAKLRVWVMCREIDEGSWAAAGEIVHFEQLREMAAAEREKSQPQQHQPVSRADAPSLTHLEQPA